MAYHFFLTVFVGVRVLHDEGKDDPIIEDTWHLGRLGNQSTDGIAGPLDAMFDFDGHHAPAPPLILNSLIGNP